MQHLLPVETGQQGKVEIGQFLEQGEVGLLDAPFSVIGSPSYLIAAPACENCE
ncbi:MAG TPA: hypothetical protein PKE45_21790 [Caldilineaceae bacterium]|jgi:hypothetical protein|nr:hypothetical protein [Caldilineaceae bacterium]